MNPPISKATSCLRNDLVKFRYPLVNGHGSRIVLRKGGGFHNLNPVKDALVCKLPDAPVHKIILKLPVKRAVMLWRQSHRQRCLKELVLRV